MKSITRPLMLKGTFAACIALSPLSFAGPLGVYEGGIDWEAGLAQGGCLTVRDAVSCSAPLLNYLNGLDPTTKVADGGYVLPTPQGALESYIVLTSGGGAQENSDTDPSPAEVEDGFKSNDTTNDDFFATGQTGSTAGNLNDPDNNDLGNLDSTLDADSLGTWDVGIEWLINALTIDGIRRELTIGFDYNQPQNTTTSLDYWALVTVRDLDNQLADINYEIGQVTGLTYDAYVTEETFNSKPESSDFATVNGVTCIDDDGILPILPIPGGQCPAGYETAIDNAQSTSDTEIFAFLPELNAMLEALLAQGYDTISTRMLFGCFGGTAGGDFQPGLGYLEDEGNGGETTNCETGGFADVYLLAGAPMDETDVPSPATLALFGLALAGIGFRRKLKAK
ncbi:hypothetical protein BTA51_27255 [Hahella sp. CCB-MM4]|uniref:PEP-CTERM sorting domain-containing protein n=1 Tax=Hahella sp. (strain CCB-MM4) TaxID=1926491 RepID=UPI000B9B0AFA|nr:PEP-CTERM sorting domain-containing protein [Hahella sp. CCB-MM4]OZG70175.1 hypothetical protein BTA51_27255 [Hahella sp. CCB-MM4]